MSPCNNLFRKYMLQNHYKKKICFHGWYKSLNLQDLYIPHILHEISMSHICFMRSLCSYQLITLITQKAWKIITQLIRKNQWYAFFKNHDLILEPYIKLILGLHPISLFMYMLITYVLSIFYLKYVWEILQIFNIY